MCIDYMCISILMHQCTIGNEIFYAYHSPTASSLQHLSPQSYIEYTLVDIPCVRLSST
jgi:hypothetical protein